MNKEFKLVPVEPDEGMMRAALAAMSAQSGNIFQALKEAIGAATQPPALAKVVLPERLKHYENREPGRQPYQNGNIDGWNACLDAIAKLNGGQS